MATAFPGGLDSLTNPTAIDLLSSPDHALQHANANDSIEALETKVGINASSDTTSLDYLVAHNLGMPLGLAGATQPTRYVGARATAAPTANTWQAGDFMILQNGGVAICTVGGTPGTWVTIGGSSISMVLADYIIYRSGSTFFARNTSTGVDDFSSSNAASVVQSAHDALGRAGLIEIKRGATYTATSMVTASQPGVLIRSTPQVGEDQSTLWQLTSSLAAGSAAFRVTGSGSGLGGISVDANGNADYGVDLRSAGGFYFESNVKGANIANMYVNGPNGAARCVIWGIRSDNPAGNGGINMKFDGPDHIAWGMRSTGTATNGYAFWADTSRLQLSTAHITGNNDEAGAVFISGEENRLSDLYLDTGPNGTNGQAHVTLQAANGNHISALIQNATLAPITVNVTSVAFVSGTTYRFACSTPHGYTTGNVVQLTGFASSTGAFTGGITTKFAGKVVGTPVDATHFDVDLLATTAFTDQVGTAQRNFSNDVTAVASTGVGNVYRFTTTYQHEFAIGDAVWLQGFASSTGFFNGTTQGNVLVSAVSAPNGGPYTFDADLGASTTFTDQVGTASQITKYALLFTKGSSGDFCQGNELEINFQGKGANLNNGEFYYAVGFLDENGNNISNFARFIGNRVVGNAANVTRFSNIEATWGTITNVDRVHMDVWQYQGDTTTPSTWRTRASGVTGSVSATTVTVNHGLAGLPARVQVTPRGDPAGRVWVSNITATSFVINSSAAPSAITYGWIAEM